uniref:Uncharacterized protein n=1 Tax=Oryza nivara TaxID=4536 RepID=A0A0E0GDQ3_ORYNI
MSAAHLFFFSLLLLLFPLLSSLFSERGSHRQSGVTGFSSVEATSTAAAATAGSRTRSQHIQPEQRLLHRRRILHRALLVAAGLTVQLLLDCSHGERHDQTGMAAAANDTTPAPGPGCSSSCWWKRSRLVLYTEARKDAVDFLIGLLRVRLVRR